ncbi:MAG: hypothetical protein P4L45_05175, partial [Ignavibacteriaceae bacterium]|nr:hypothetical protein [Ignavibacteriaceae bacterium]
KILIIEFERVLKELMIKIDYDSGKKDELCSYCGWYMEVKKGGSIYTSSASGSILAPGSGSIPPLDHVTASGLDIPYSTYTPYTPLFERVCQNPGCPHSTL